jgi:hypothetical protein
MIFNRSHRICFFGHGWHPSGHHLGWSQECDSWQR